MGQFYAIINYNQISTENIDSHIIRCIDKNHAMTYPNASIIIEKKVLEGTIGKNLPSMYTVVNSYTNFYYPHVITYDIMDVGGKPFNISYGNNICEDFQILTRRGGSRDDSGCTDVKIRDRFGKYLYKRLEAGYDVDIRVIKNLIVELINFENTCFSILEVYQLREKLERATSYSEWGDKDIKKLQVKIEENKKKIESLENELQIKDKEIKKMKIQSNRSKRNNNIIRKLKLG